jgi:hypothetical protein
VPSEAAAAQLVFNDRLDAVVALAFMAVVVLLLAASLREWVRAARAG